MKTHSDKFLRQRKLMMALPVLVTPFLTLLFWSLDGGKGSYASSTIEVKGLNPQVPNANLDNGLSLDKFSLYERAKRDSLRKAEAERTDPYYRLRTITEIQKRDSFGLINHSLGRRNYDLDSNEVAVAKRLNAIKSIISGQQNANEQRTTARATETEPNTDMDESVDRLEAMMLMMQDGNANDPELQQIEGVLEKILDVQHPERVRGRLESESMASPGKVFSVSTDQGVLKGSFFGVPDSLKRKTGFYNSKNHSAQGTRNLVKAIVDQTQPLMDESTIKLRLVNDIYVHGRRVPKGSFVYGNCSLQNDRLSVKVNSIFFADAIYPIKLVAYDLDGLEGLYVPGTLTNDASRQGSNQLLQDLQIMNVDPSFQAQAAGAGIQTMKSLLGKKTKIIKVHVKAGHSVLLRDISSTK
jgi:conjugative transposon TraM protein